METATVNPLALAGLLRDRQWDRRSLGLTVFDFIYYYMVKFESVCFLSESTYVACIANLIVYVYLRFFLKKLVS